MSLPCASQNLVPFIRLSPDEVTKAKQLAQSLKDAEERNNQAKVAWQQFHQAYQAAHPNLRSVKFTDDCRLAIAKVDAYTSGVFQAASIELTPEQRKKLESLRQEMTESEQSRKQAQNAWWDFNTQLVADHVGDSGAGAYSELTLSSGKHVRIYAPWTATVVFTSDFKLAFPLDF
jgi:uncharacterized membrane-anchored protein YjiN (DUF445 family)